MNWDKDLLFLYFLLYLLITLKHKKMKAKLSNYRQAPRKTRLVVDCIRGKKTKEAISILRGLDKKSALPIYKLLLSAISNAKQKGQKTEDLIVSKIFVNEGIILKRFRPRARGQVTPIRKRSSIIELELK